VLAELVAPGDLQFLIGLTSVIRKRH
jgi:hypothetical protein